MSTAIALGETCRAIAVQFEIAPSTVVKWSKRLRETGSAAPAKFGGYRTCSLEPHREFLLAQIEAASHLTLRWTSPGLVESHLLFPFRRPERCFERCRTDVAEGNRRFYDEADLPRLTIIRHARELGFEIEAIRTLLTHQDKPDQSCAEADSVARA